MADSHGKPREIRQRRKNCVAGLPNKISCNYNNPNVIVTQVSNGKSFEDIGQDLYLSLYQYSVLHERNEFMSLPMLPLCFECKLRTQDFRLYEGKAKLYKGK